MRTPLIGVLGCGGALGHIACNVLKRTYKIRGGQRRQPAGMTDDSHFQWVKVDLYNEKELYEFCKGCDVILNCAGPSYLVGDRVALAAAEANAFYVDTFGAGLIEKLLLKKGLEKEGVFVIAAGSFPGLSGILPRWLAKQEFDSVATMLSFAGGREHCSTCAGLDLLLSSVSNYGIPGASLKKGSVVRASDADNEKVYIPFLKEEVYQQKFLNDETIKLAKLLQLEEAAWCNIIVDKIVNDTILKSSARLSMDRSDNELREASSELCAAANMALNGNSPWYVMTTELQGDKNGRLIRKRCILRSKSSYELSGVVAAVAVETLLKHKIRPGIFWAFEVLDPVETIERLLVTKAAAIIDIVDIPPVRENGMHSQMNEGVL
jgi:hypothetical protein